MPTKHPRVSVTLTPPLRDAQEALRRNGINASVADLALAGAQQMAAAAKDDERAAERAREVRRRLVERLRNGDAFDSAALREVREEGWTRT